MAKGRKSEDGVGKNLEDDVQVKIFLIVDIMREYGESRTDRTGELTLHAVSNILESHNRPRYAELYPYMVSLEKAILSGRDPRQNLALLLFSMEQYAQSTEIYRALTQENPCSTYWNDLGISLARSGEDEKAIIAYRKALSLDPCAPTTWFNIGKALYRMEKYQDALVAFSECAARDPKNKSAWNNMGITFKFLGDSKSARECYIVALDIDSGYAWAWHNLGILAMDEGDKQEAKKMFTRAICVKPGYAPSVDMLEKIEEDTEDITKGGI